VGAWLRQYGQSIYRTRGGPWKPGDYGASTRSGRTVFVHAMRWQQDTLRLPPIQAKVLSAQTLTGAKAHVRQDAQGLCIRVAPADRDPIDTIIALRLNAPAMNEPAVSVP
jgi:alpha-L-fucosidase